jgi:small subunit ribosomal protein S3Ae
MAVGKNKRLTKGKKGGKKKIVDPFTKKEWYKIKAPSVFKNRSVGQTLVTRSAGTKLAADGLRGRVYEINQADLQGGDESTYRKFKLVCEEVQGDACLTNFHGMELTRDKQCSIIKKWQTKIEAHVDCSTTDGYKLRLFCVGFTKRRQNQIKKTTYAQTTQVRAIRKKMMDIMRREVTNTDIRGVVTKLLPDSMASDITKTAASTYPLHEVHVKKVKVLKKPRFDVSKLLEMHGEGGKVVTKKDGEQVVTDNYEPPVLQSV